MRVNVVHESAVEFLVSSTNESVREVEAVLAEYFSVTGKNFVPAMKILMSEMVGNAIEWGNQFNEAKDVRIRVVQEQKKLKVLIEDQGSGFNKSIIDYFDQLDPLQLQEEREKMGKRPGGLGVKICKGLSEELQYNEAGNQVIFSVSLEPIDTGRALIEQAKEAGEQEDKKRVLIVEDDKELARLYEDALEVGGYDYFVAKNGFTASLLLAAYNPHLVTLDIEMPLLDGMKVIDYLHESASLYNILVISGLIDAERQQRFEQLGIPYLHKPVDLNEYLESVRAMTELR